MNERHNWTVRAALVILGVGIGSVATLCVPDHHERGERERDREPMHARPAVELAMAAHDAAVDAEPDAHDGAAPRPVVIPSELPKPADAGPSCGSHPWCVVPLECCEPDGSCCAS